MFIFVSLIVALATLIYWWQKRAYSFWVERGITQLQPTFPLGTFSAKKNFAYTNDEIYRKYKGKSKYVGMYTFMAPAVMAIDEDVIKDIMVKDFQFVQSHGGFFNEVDDPISAHLFNIEGQKWRDLRMKLTPTFTSGKMKVMCPIVVDLGTRFKETIDKMIERGDKGVDMRDMFAKFTTDVIGTCAFGLECNSLNDPNAKFRKMGMKVFDEPRHHQLIQFAMFAAPELARKLRMKFFPDDIGEFFIQVVEDTVQHRIKNNIKRNDFVDLLIELRNEKKSNSVEDSHMEGLSMNEIAAQCFVFFLGGFETSSTSSSFTIYELARNQAVQDKLRAHIHDILKKHNGQLTYEALKDMTYLDQCIKEGLRMYPPLPMLTRVTTSEYKLPETNAVIPARTGIFIPIYSIQRDPNNFPDPEQYDPERFTAEEVSKRHHFTYLSFGEGPRVCIGERFGMMQAKVGLVNLIGNYRFTLNPKTKPIVYKYQSFVLTPEEPLYFDIEKI